MNSIQPVKIAIVGTGSVGASFAYALLLQGLATEILLIDKDMSLAEGQAMDLQHTVPFSHQTEIVAGRVSDIAGAAVTVICAGQRQKPGGRRSDLMKHNAGVIKELVPQIARHNPDGAILVATEPVDVLTYGAWKLSGLPRRQVMGSGTVPDTARFCYLLGKHFRVDPHSVNAFILGEHGESELPVWSAANIAGIPIRQLCAKHGCEPDLPDKIFRETVAATDAIIARKGATCYAIAAALVRIVASVVRNEKRILTVSSVLENEYGVTDVALSVPAVVGNKGIDRLLPLELSDDEVGELFVASQKVREASTLAEFVIRPRMMAS